jgi:CRP-like cAMP-binding protein
MTASVQKQASSGESVKRTFSCLDTLPVRQKMLWKIESGVLRTYTFNETGTRNILGYWGVGDVIGHPLSRLNPYEIECLTSVEVVLIPPELWHEVLEAIMLHAQQTKELLYVKGYERAHHRLLHLLIWLAQKFGRAVHQGNLIDVPLTHEGIAESIGSTRVTITRLLKQFEREGIIYRDHRNIIVPSSFCQTPPVIL